MRTRLHEGLERDRRGQSRWARRVEAVQRQIDEMNADSVEDIHRKYWRVLDLAYKKLDYETALQLAAAWKRKQFPLVSQLSTPRCTR